MIESGEIKMKPGKMISVLLLLNGLPWMIMAFAGIVIFILAGVIFDFRFYFLALIWLFLFLPLIMAFLYFFYGMKPLTAFNTIPHFLKFDDSSIIVEFENETLHEESEEKVEADLPRERKEYTVEKDKIKEIKTGGDYILLLSKKDGWLYVPYSSLGSLEIYKKLITDFSKDLSLKNEQ